MHEVEVQGGAHEAQRAEGSTAKPNGAPPFDKSRALDAEGILDAERFETLEAELVADKH